MLGHDSIEEFSYRAVQELLCDHVHATELRFQMTPTVSHLPRAEL